MRYSGLTGTNEIPAHGTDGAGNSQSDTTFTLTLDNTAPTGGSISVPAYATSTSVTITSGNYTDAGFGITSNVLTRSNGQAPTAGACPGSGYSGSTVVSSPDVTVANLLVVTFTVAAAAELRGRFRAHLARASHRLGADGAPGDDPYLEALAASADHALHAESEARVGSRHPRLHEESERYGGARRSSSRHDMAHRQAREVDLQQAGPLRPDVVQHGVGELAVGEQ